jgi:hypothetical protein
MAPVEYQLTRSLHSSGARRETGHKGGGRPFPLHRLYTPQQLVFQQFRYRFLTAKRAQFRPPPNCAPTRKGSYFPRLGVRVPVRVRESQRCAHIESTRRDLICLIHHPADRPGTERKKIWLLPWWRYALFVPDKRSNEGRDAYERRIIEEHVKSTPSLAEFVLAAQLAFKVGLYFLLTVTRCSLDPSSHTSPFPSSKNALFRSNLKS